MQPTHAYCQKVLDATGQVVAPPANSRRHDISVPGVSHPICWFLIGGNDIVSTQLAHGGWESGATAWILERLRESSADSPLFVDIGANVGTHAVQVAASGFRTLAIEAAPTNQLLLRTTYCANQRVLRDTLTLAGTALGNQTQSCSMWAPAINTGNGMMYCGDKKPEPGMVRLGDATTQRLDELVTEPVAVVKMDVEGFEAHVLAGATRLLSTGKIDWLTFEYSPAAVAAKGGDPWALLANLVAYGFSCRHPGNRQQDLSPMEMLALAQHVNSTKQMDLFCRRSREPLQFVA